MAQQGQWQELDQSNSRRSTTATNSTKRQRSIRVREPIRPSLLTCLTPPTTSSAPTLPLCPRHAPGARVLADRGCQVVAAEEAASHHHHWPKVWFGRHPATSHLLTCHTRNINIKIQIQKHKNTKLTKRLVWTTPWFFTPAQWALLASHTNYTNTIFKQQIHKYTSTQISNTKLTKRLLLTWHASTCVAVKPHCYVWVSDQLTMFCVKNITRIANAVQCHS